jgi:hypothetical protein
MPKTAATSTLSQKPAGSTAHPDTPDMLLLSFIAQTRHVKKKNAEAKPAANQFSARSPLNKKIIVPDK